MYVQWGPFNLPPPFGSLSVDTPDATQQAMCRTRGEQPLGRACLAAVQLFVRGRCTSPTGMKCRQEWQLPRPRRKGQGLVVAHYPRRDTCTLVADHRRRGSNHSPAFQRRNSPPCLGGFGETVGFVYDNSQVSHTV